MTAGHPDGDIFGSDLFELSVQAVTDPSGSHGGPSEEFSRQRMHDAGVVIAASRSGG